MPPAHKKYSNDKRELVYISPKKKVAYCKVPKVGTNSWGSFFARAGEVKNGTKIYFKKKVFLIQFLLVVGTLKNFEKKMHISINNRTLEQLRAQAKMKTGSRKKTTNLRIFGFFVLKNCLNCPTTVN